ncbi:hypothetical protein TRICI_006460 [Trichomonascus ciferrii]|uniref:Magnesium transport protein CorA n=1 Tax=Trichomonascus ciferrii TaxID=44093 RepID=A0A642UL92_9ASCO|nr:hypothetical protein TRICI_006460 [Trichomonascus ciferrii]
MTLKKEVYSSEDPDKQRLPEDVVEYEKRERRATIIEGMTGTGGVTWADEQPEESEEEKESNKRSSKRFSNRVSGLWEERKPKAFAGKYKLNTSLKPPDSPIASPFSQPLHLQPSNMSQERYQPTVRSNDSSAGQGDSEGGATSERAEPKVRRKYTSLTVPGSLATERRRAGWEPGINIKNTDVILNSVGSCISIVDYDSSRYRIVKTEVQIGDENSKELISMLKDRPKWSQVRWVNVNGLSWEAISVIAEYYQLHRLAVEDMVDIPQRTKVDKYPTHTFCCFPLQKLIQQRPRRPRKKDKLFATAIYEPTESFDQFTFESAVTRTNQSVRFDAPGGPSVAQKLEKMNMNTIYQWTNPQSVENKRTVFLEARRPLARLNRVVGVEQVSLFLTDQSTVISFFEKSGNDIENPLLSRISSESTLLRESGDPAVLFQAIIDAVVDLLYPIINCYRERLDDLQIDAIISPSVAHTRQLHLVNSDLTMLRNSIVPITVAINSLREHAVDHQSKYSRPPEDNTTYAIQTNRDQPRTMHVGKSGHTLISDLATMYLGDVADHTLTYTQDLDVMQSNVKSMIDLVFNTISIQSSDAVRLLSLVTVVFLPLSFLTGYFGMNFKNFDILDHSDGFYWGIAIPFAVVLVLILMWRWVVDKWRYLLNEFRKLLEKRKKRKEKELAKKRTSTRDAKEFA